MRFESVTAHAFGPLADASLDLAPGFTLIWGANEAGKSSWHAALYFGLCARKRGRGRPDRAEQALIDRHRPWDGPRWEVATVVRLGDGRRIELRHDLAGLVACRATDLALGRDCSGEIIQGNDAPDGARWLGLDRRSFLAVACVRQADLLAVREHPAVLQEHLQRAAATGGADATAAGALDRLERFRRAGVGAAQANAVGPLRRALDGVGAARAALADAQRAHAEYVALAARADGLEREARAAERAVGQARARQALAEARAARRQADRARALATRFPSGPPPAASADDRVALDVAAAVRGWEGRPAEPRLDGPSADQLRAELSALPPAPDGDLEPHATVQATYDDFSAALAAFRQHERVRPERAGSAAAGGPPRSPAGVQSDAGPTEQELRALADTLAAPDVPLDPVLVRGVADAQRRVDAVGRGGQGSVPLAAGVAVAALGALLVALDYWLAGLALILAGAACVGWAVMGRGGAHARALEALRAAEAALGERRFAAEATRRMRADALDRARRLGLPADPAALRRHADERRSASLTAHDVRRWEEQRAPLERACATAYDRLVRALRARGVVAGDDAARAFETYCEACRMRARHAAGAARRSDLERRIAGRLAADEAAAEARRRVRDARAALVEVALRCGLPGNLAPGGLPTNVQNPDGPPDALAAQLRTWLAGRSASLAAEDERRQGWAELRAILGARTLADLERDAAEREHLAARLAHESGYSDAEAGASVGGGELRRGSLAGNTADDSADTTSRIAGPVASAAFDGLEGAASAANAASARARGEADQRARMQVSVPEAEEALAAAEEEAAQVRALAHTLDLTRDFLQNAQQHVHRDVAPALNAAVERWLPAVTAGRYTRALIDPADLGVKIAGPNTPWRDAALLSHGTAEQVYLLLRVALADRLTARGAACPLILDDVTAHCDAERTRAVLETLRSLSRERQIVLFSQEDAVLAWADDALRDPEHRVIRLPAPAIAG